MLIAMLIAVSSEETIINIMPVGIGALSGEDTCVRGTGRGSRGFRISENPLKI